MKELNELVRLANLANIAGHGTPQMADFRVTANTDTILAIAEAFRMLEQRAEAAEAKAANLSDGWLSAITERDEARAKLAELESIIHQFGRKQGVAAMQSAQLVISALSERPAPAVSLVYLENFALYMADESVKSGNYPDGWQCKASNAAHEYVESCRAAILRNIEEAK